MSLLYVEMCQAEEADFTADLHGHWTLENAKSRLHQFLQTNRIKADYKYMPYGPDHSRFELKEPRLFDCGSAHSISLTGSAVISLKLMKWDVKQTCASFPI